MENIIHCFLQGVFKSITYQSYWWTLRTFLLLQLDQMHLDGFLTESVPEKLYDLDLFIDKHLQYQIRIPADVNWMTSEKYRCLEMHTSNIEENKMQINNIVTVTLSVSKKPKILGIVKCTYMWHFGYQIKWLFREKQCLQTQSFCVTSFLWGLFCDVQILKS